MSNEWCDITPAGQEIYPPEPEYTQSTEYYEQNTSAITYDTEAEKERLHKKQIRKLLYGITAAVMVFSLGKTITNAEPVGILSEQKVWFNEYDHDTNYGKNGVLTIGGPHTILGVGHVPQEFYYVDYNGNTITIEAINRFSYHGKWINSNGYALTDTNGNDVYTVFDKTGEVLYEWKDEDFPGTNMNAAAISDNNIVFIQREVRTDGTNHVQNSYYTLTGKELCSIDFDASISHNGMAKYGTPFRDGIALCNDSTGILLVKENGKTERLAEWKPINDERNIRERFQVGNDGTIEGTDGRYILANVPCVISGNASLGYFIVTDTRGNMALVSLHTGEMYKTKLHSANSNIENAADSNYICYSDNEGTMLNYGTTMCVVEKNNAKERKYFLFDVTKHCDENGNRTGYLACHDAIYFEDYQYLAARDGNDYFYIDLTGNRVSEIYKKASTFNDFGYALVQTQSNAFYVIDSEFNKLERLSEIEDFYVKDAGEVFWVTCEEEPHSYYYGPDVF